MLHSPRGYRIAFLLTGDEDLAADLVHDAFVRLFGRFQDLRDPGAFEAYLRRTLVNLANSHYRRRRVERAYAARFGGVPIQSADGYDVNDQVHQWLVQLPVRQRAAIVLRYFEDLSEQQSAEALDISVPALKGLVQRAMATLRTRAERI